MKKKLLSLICLLYFFAPNISNAQISFTDMGCFNSSVTLNQNGTTNDGQVRNTFDTSPLDGIPMLAEIQIIWNTGNNRWEFLADGDFNGSYETLVYYNSSGSYPNPPDLTLGSWTDVQGCGNILTLTGDVQSIITSDTAPPIAQNITLDGTPAGNASSVTFTVTFDENANNLTTDDFSVTTTSGNASGTVSGVSASSGTSVTVTVNSITGVGVFRLDLKASTNITDDSGNGNGTNGLVAAYISGGTHTVTDSTDPVITICASTPANISANGSCQGTTPDLTGSVTATDNSGVTPVITQSPVAGATLGLGTTTITLTATDGAGNTDTCQVNQTVVDDTDPVILVCASTPSNIIANASCQGTMPDLTGTVTATDNCTGSPVITQSPSAGATLGLGTIAVTLTVTDGAGNSATCQVNQTVVDNTDPVILVCASTPANISANASCQGTMPDLTGTVTATDNCTGSPVITQSPAAGATLGLGKTTVTLTATDGAGNTATCKVNQTVVDDTDPVITVCASIPANISANASCQGTMPDLTGTVTATDNCTGSPVVTQSPAAGATLGLGTTTITLTATDGSGNTATCQVNQTVVDDTDPVITVCAPTPNNICNGMAPDLTGSVTATDNCTGSPVITQSPVAGAALPLGSSIITLTVTDGSGNTDTCLVNVTYNPVDASVSTTSPTITANETGATYRWLDCNNGNAVISDETAQSFTASSNGSYAVEVTKNGCTKISECVTISTLSLKKDILDNIISIYPNPVQEIVNVKLRNSKDVTIKVSNLKGQLIYQKAKINSSTHSFELNAAPGVYFIEVITDGNKQQFKIVKK